MTRARDRAVAVVLRDDAVLVIGRQRDGRAYCVLPGGGVDPGEVPEVAVLRELAEETGLSGTVERHLWTLDHDDRRAHYFLVAVEPGPLVLGGPEASRQSSADTHTPRWLPISRLDAEVLQPSSVRDLVRGVGAGQPARVGGTRVWAMAGVALAAAAAVLAWGSVHSVREVLLHGFAPSCSDGHPERVARHCELPGGPSSVHVAAAVAVVVLALVGLWVTRRRSRHVDPAGAHSS